MANAMNLLDAAIRVVMDDAVTSDTLDRIKAAYPVARRDHALLFSARDDKDMVEPSRIGELWGFDGETDTLNCLLDYQADESGIWFNDAFVKPAIVGLAIWLDRMADPENRTALQASLQRTEDLKSGYGVKLSSLDLQFVPDTPAARKATHLRAQAILTAAAWWGLNSPTAQRLGFVALEAEAAQQKDNISARHDESIRHEIGPSPYVTIEDVSHENLPV